MEVLVSEELLRTLMIGMAFSVILMAMVQKVKTLSFVKYDYQIMIANLILSFGVGIPFCLTFYDESLIMALWVSVFGFVGAPGIYEVLKKQNIINYKPRSLDDMVNVPKENYIDR